MACGEIPSGAFCTRAATTVCVSRIGKCAKHPVALAQRGDLITHFDDRAQAHVAEAAGKASVHRFAAAVQAQFAVPAVGGVGRVGAEAAQFRAVLDRAKEALDADFVRGQGRFLVRAEDRMAGAVSNQFERHEANSCERG